jgi:hypothetical protein
MPKPTKPEADLLELMRADRVVQNRRAAREAARDSADDVSGKAKAAKAARRRPIGLRRLRRKSAKTAGRICLTSTTREPARPPARVWTRSTMQRAG